MMMEKVAAPLRLPRFKTIKTVETGLAARAHQQRGGGDQLEAAGSHG